jgi:hypothetical protein
MIANINARLLSDHSIFVQYHLDGKAYDASFATWFEFAKWLRGKVENNGD